MDLIPVGDFSCYEHVLDTSVMLGVVPERFGPVKQTIDSDSWFGCYRALKSDNAVNDDPPGTRRLCSASCHGNPPGNTTMLHKGYGTIASRNIENVFYLCVELAS